MHPLSSFSKLLEAVGKIVWRGPIGKTGTLHCCRNCSNGDRSRQSTVLQMTAEDDLMSLVLAVSCRKVSRFLKLAMGRSLNLRG